MNFFTRINNVQAKAVSMMTAALNDLMHKEDGMTTVEYAIAGALISSAVVIAFQAMGNQIGTAVNNITTAIG